VCTRSTTLLDLGQVPEAAEAARRSLAVARELGYPDGEVFALVLLAGAAAAAGDLGEAVRLARQADQVPGDIVPSTARSCRILLRGRSGRVPGRGRPEGPAVPAVLDGAAGPAGRPRQRRRGAAARSHPAICAGRRRDLEQYYLDYCGYLCAATGRPAEAVTMWAAHAALTTRENLPGTARHRGSRCARPGRRWDRPGFGPPSSAARR